MPSKSWRLDEVVGIRKVRPSSKFTSSEILDAVKGLLERSNDGDSILFFYAGHGEAINNESYLILPGTNPANRETTALKLSDLTYYLSKNKRLNVRIFDTCHSGQNIRSSDWRLNSEDFIRNVLAEGGEGSITFASCAITEKSYWDDDLKQGVFSHSLARAIEGCPENSDIYAEFIKVEVCKSVQAWCAVNGKTQTPTFSAYVNGNMPIARRQTDVLPKVVPPSEKPLAERLIGMRSVEIINASTYPLLRESAEEIYKSLDLKAKSIDYYGIHIGVKKPTRVNDIPELMQQKIVIKMRQEKTLHDMEIVREEGTLTDFERVLGKKAPIFTHYYLTQEYAMPESFVLGELPTDGYVPKSSVFFYVCPLQASIALLYGYYFSTSFQAEDSEIGTFALQRKNYSIVDFRARRYLDLIGPLLAAFEEDLNKQIGMRLNQLEQELKNVVQ